MSRQLAISSAVSIFTMAAFALLSGQAETLPLPGTEMGAGWSVSAPSLLEQAPWRLLLPFEIG